MMDTFGQSPTELNRNGCNGASWNVKFSDDDVDLVDKGIQGMQLV